MAAKKQQTPRKTYRLLRRYLSGLTTLCVVLITIGGIKANVSFLEITLRAILLVFGVALFQWLIIRAWAAWEVTSGSSDI
jgi:hypothetical protein